MSHSGDDVEKTSQPTRPMSRILFKRVHCSEMSDESNSDIEDGLLDLSPIGGIFDDSSDTNSSLVPNEKNTSKGNAINESDIKMNQSFSCKKEQVVAFDSFNDDDMFNESVIRSTQAIEEAIFDKSKNRFLSPAAVKKAMSKLNMNKDSKQVLSLGKSDAKSSTPQREIKQKESIFQQKLSDKPLLKMCHIKNEQTVTTKSGETENRSRYDFRRQREMKEKGIKCSSPNIRSLSNSSSRLNDSSKFRRHKSAHSSGVDEDRVKETRASSVRRVNSDSFAVVDFCNDDSFFEEVASSIPDNENMLTTWAKNMKDKKSNGSLIQGVVQKSVPEVKSSKQQIVANHVNEKDVFDDDFEMDDDMIDLISQVETNFQTQQSQIPNKNTNLHSENHFKMDDFFFDVINDFRKDEDIFEMQAIENHASCDKIVNNIKKTVNSEEESDQSNSLVLKTKNKPKRNSKSPTTDANEIDNTPPSTRTYQTNYSLRNTPRKDYNTSKRKENANTNVNRVLKIEPVSSVPSSPKTSVPSAPKTGVPSTPKFSVPTIPKTSVPTIPKTTVPSVPKATMPSATKTTLPSVPKATMPSATKATMPSATKTTLPSVPKATMPSATKTTLPSVPKTIVSKPSIPSAPRAAVPSTPRTTLPSAPEPPTKYSKEDIARKKAEALEKRRILRERSTRK